MKRTRPDSGVSSPTDRTLLSLPRSLLPLPAHLPPQCHASLYIKALFISLWTCRAHSLGEVGTITPHFLVLGWYWGTKNQGSNPSTDSPALRSFWALVSLTEMRMILDLKRKHFLLPELGCQEPSVLRGRQFVPRRSLIQWSPDLSFWR